jgi:hypothetical protein
MTQPLPPTCFTVSGFETVVPSHLLFIVIESESTRIDRCRQECLRCDCHCATGEIAIEREFVENDQTQIRWSQVRRVYPNVQCRPLRLTSRGPQVTERVLAGSGESCQASQGGLRWSRR